MNALAPMNQKLKFDEVPPIDRLRPGDKVRLLKEQKTVRKRFLANVGDIGTVTASGITPLTGMRWVELKVHSRGRNLCCAFEDVKKIC